MIILLLLSLPLFCFNSSLSMEEFAHEIVSSKSRSLKERFPKDKERGKYHDLRIERQPADELSQGHFLFEVVGDANKHLIQHPAMFRGANHLDLQLAENPRV